MHLIPTAPADGKPPSDGLAIGCSEIDESNPRSVINLLPTWFRDRVLSINKTLLYMTEQELAARMFPAARKPAEIKRDRVLHNLRLQFWDEYDRAQRESLPKMEMSRILDRVCALPYFRDEFCRSDNNIVWILIPPSHYTLNARECLRLGVERMMEIMSTSAVDEHGQVDTKLAEIQLKMYQVVDTRVNGAVVQTVHQKNLNVNIDGSAPAAGVENAKTKMSIEQINARIAELEQKQNRKISPPEIRPALPTALGETIDAEIVREHLPSEAPTRHPTDPPV